MYQFLQNIRPLFYGRMSEFFKNAPQQLFREGIILNASKTPYVSPEKAALVMEEVEKTHLPSEVSEPLIQSIASLVFRPSAGQSLSLSEIELRLQAVNTVQKILSSVKVAKQLKVVSEIFRPVVPNNFEDDSSRFIFLNQCPNPRDRLKTCEPIGYGALVKALQISFFMRDKVFTNSLDMPSEFVVSQGANREGVLGHLEFAIKYEGIDISLIKQTLPPSSRSVFY